MWFLRIKLIVNIVRVWLRPFAWCLFAGTTTIHAADLEWLYDVEFSVTDQSEAERLDALREGLETVLIRITGLRELPDSSPIEAAFSELNAYQLQFRYEQESARDNDGNNTRLVISYDANAVQALIRDAGLPVWSAQRPHVLFLISIVDEGRRTVLNKTHGIAVQDVIRATALRRGVDYSQPLMDFTDRVILREGAIAFGFITSVVPLQQRLRADIVVVVRIDPSVFNQHRVWLTIHDVTGQRALVFDAGDLPQTTAEVVHRTADYLAQRYAVTGGEATALRLAVTGISDIVDYKAVLDYLSKWEFIERVLLSSVKRDRFEFELRTTSSWEQLVIYFDEDGVLIPHLAVSQSADQIPEYEWQN